MSDSDDDNIVRYGTQLEPYEEDCTCTMPKPKTKSRGIRAGQKHKMKRLLAANVNVNKAREVCHLSWPQICEIIPGIEHIAPEKSLNPPKESKEKHPTVRVRPMEHLSREPDQIPRRNPCDARDTRRTSQDRSPSPNYRQGSHRRKPSTLRHEYDTNQESFLHQPYRPPQTYTRNTHTSEPNYWEEAGPSQKRAYETNRRKRRPSEGEPHWEPPYKVLAGSQLDCGEPNYWERDRSPPRSRHGGTSIDCRSNSYEQQLKYSDTDALQVNVEDGMRSVNHHYNDRSDVKPFSDQPYKGQKTSSEGRMRAVNHHYNERSDVKPFSDQSYKGQKSSSEGRMSAVNRHYNERSDVKPFSDQCYKGQKTSSEDRMRAVNRHYNDRSDVKPFSDQSYKGQKTSSEGRMRSVNRHYNDRSDVKPFSDQSYKGQKTSSEGRMRAVNRHYNDRSDVKPFSDQPHKAQKTSSEGGASLNYWPEPDRPSRLGLRNETHAPKRTHTYSHSEDNNLQVSKYQKMSTDHDYKDSDRPLRDGLRNETQAMTTVCSDDESDEEYRGRVYTPHTPVDDGTEHFDFREPDHTGTKSERDSHFHWDQPSENQETFEDKDAKVNKDAEPIQVGIRNVTPMTKKEMTLVHQAINQAIVRIGVQGAGPKFSGCKYKTGWILMICENHKSRKWLEKKVPSLKPWPEANLSITPQNELTKPHYVTLSILIRDKEGVTVATALELLRIQNPGLDRDNWKVIKVTKTYSGQIVLLSVDEASFEALRVLNFKANLGMDKVSFWLRSGPIKRDSFVPSTEDVPLASSSAYADRESNSISGAGENTTKKVSRKRHRNRIRGHITDSQPIEKPSLLGRPVLLPSGPILPEDLKPNSPKEKKRWYDCYGNAITQ